MDSAAVDLPHSVIRNQGHAAHGEVLLATEGLPGLDLHLELPIEAHLFDTGGDLYGAYVRIEFLAWLRETRAFDGVEALRAQLARDEEAARRALSGSGSRSR